MTMIADSTTRVSPTIRRLMLEAVRSPRRVGVTIFPTSNGESTEIHLQCEDGSARRWVIAAQPCDISENDIRPIRKFLQKPSRCWSSILTAIPQLLGWSVGATGLFAASTMCPCCGQFGCALGVGTMGIMGGLTAAIMSCIHRRRHKQQEEPQSC